MIPELNELIREKENYNSFEQKIIDILDKMDQKLEKLNVGYEK